MRGFVKIILLYTTIVGLGMLAVLLLADGNTDPFYLRFTTPRQEGLIVGTSRPGQALLPSRIRMAAGQNDDAAALYNFSFTLVHSPYGPTYLEAIRAKMDHDVRNAVHIVSVEPWSICIDRSQADDPRSYNEQNLCLGTTPSLNMDPNIPYLLRSYKDKYMDIVEHRILGNETFLHDDGWLQINSNLTEAKKDIRRKITLADFREKARNMRFSTVRLGYLINTIELLSTTGKVHLVRLPISKPLLTVEDSLMPGFDALMRSLAKSSGIPYINYTDSVERFTYADGGHVERESAFRISDGLGASMIVVVDEAGRVLGNGSSGELCLAGPQLTTGYWKDAEPTAAAFFTTEQKGVPIRFYRTGDHCRIDDEGDILYMGRLDQQTKVQGYRVELPEIEHHARAFLAGPNAVAIGVTNQLGNTEIALLIESGETISTKELIAHLRLKLPPYMVPSTVRCVPSFPLNVNGKTDRKALRDQIMQPTT